MISQTADDGVTWQDEIVTQNRNPKFNIRPVFVRDAFNATDAIAYVNGTQLSFTKFDTKVVIKAR